MNTHNIGFYEEISKIIPLLSSNMHRISSSDKPLLIDLENGSGSLAGFKIGGIALDGFPLPENSVTKYSEEVDSSETI